MLCVSVHRDIFQCLSGTADAMCSAAPFDVAARACVSVADGSVGGQMRGRESTLAWLELTVQRLASKLVALFRSRSTVACCEGVT